jgi:alkane 1-monooxygenase
MISFVFIWGYMAGISGLAGHELIHKKGIFHKFVGTFTFTKILYSHFSIEHQVGHHKNIATPDDPATASKGENFYSFGVKSAIGGFWHSFEAETLRLQENEEIKKNDQIQQI